MLSPSGQLATALLVAAPSLEASYAEPVQDEPAACGLAFPLGWLFLGGKPSRPQNTVNLEPNFLQGVTRDRRATPRPGRDLAAFR